MNDWCEIEKMDNAGVVTIRIRWWRPSFFIMAYRAIRAEGSTRFESLCLASLLVWRFARK